jgi:hypothetical protein
LISLANKLFCEIIENQKVKYLAKLFDFRNCYSGIG